MLHLQLLGTLDVTGTGDHRYLSVLAQPKRLALLAYLAASRPEGFHRRDTLVALMWPESDATHARNSLRQSIYFLRRTLGSEVVVSRGDDEVRVHPKHLTCDVLQFEAAVAAGRFEEALEIYQGDLLEGLYVADALPFERWMEEERTRLRALAVDAAWRLEDSAEVAADADAAVEWAWRAYRIETGNEVSLRRLMELLDRRGDRATAIQTFEDFQAQLKREFDLDPAPETLALAEGIRRREITHKTSVDSGAGVQHGTPGIRGVEGYDGLQPWYIPGTYALASAVGGVLLVLAIPLLLSTGAIPDMLNLEGGDGEEVRVRSIAALPFRNLSADPENQYFTEGFQEELLAQLSKVKALRVTARGSVARYASGYRDLWTVGHELGVRYLIQGTVQGSGDRMKISARLVDAGTGEQLWAETYARRRSDIFSIQADVAERIVEALQVRLSRSERARLAAPVVPRSPGYEAYVRGRVHWARGVNEADARAAVRLFEWATTVDPGFAAAHAALSYSRVWLAYMFGDQDQLERARSSLNRARALAPESEETWLAEGYYYAYATEDHEQALDRLLHVVDVQPSNAEALALIGFEQRRMGRWDEAVASMERALALDPNSYNSTIVLGDMYRQMRRFDDAERLFDRAVSIAPGAELAYVGQASVRLYGHGDTAAARRVLEEAPVTFSTWYQTLPALTALLRRDYPAAEEYYLHPPKTASETRLTPRGFLVLGELQKWRGRPQRARVYADSIRAYMARSDAAGDVVDGADWPAAVTHSYAAMADVLSGQDSAAVTEAEMAASIVPVSEDSHAGVAMAIRLADVYALTGRTEQAIETLAMLLSVPSPITRQILRLHPFYDPLRGDPRFERLVAEATGDAGEVEAPPIPRFH